MSIKIKKNTIFVSIASYRDDVCPITLNSLYNEAAEPNRVFVGICQQNNNLDIDCITDEIKQKEYYKNIRIIRIPFFEAKGPTWARYLCSTLWDGEEYYFQIDSHTRFVKNWDTICIDLINSIKNTGLSNKPVLSHYPEEYNYNKNNESNNKYVVPRMCKAFFNEKGMLTFVGASSLDSKNIPYKTPYLAAGMFFCESYFLNELPYDPNLDYLFVGEEILHSIRFYTNGWDIFTPTQNVIFHEYERKDKPKIWTDKTYSDENAFKKVKYYIGLIAESEKDNLDSHIKTNLDKYGLGKVRSLQDYYNFTGIDIKNKKVYTNFCNENNVASEEDILKSNKMNEKIERFISLNNIDNSNCNDYLCYLVFFIIIIILINKYN